MKVESSPPLFLRNQSIDPSLNSHVLIFFKFHISNFPVFNCRIDILKLANSEIPFSINLATGRFLNGRIILHCQPFLIFSDLSHEVNVDFEAELIAINRSKYKTKHVKNIRKARP
jgi:hypothetical protein